MKNIGKISLFCAALMSVTILTIASRVLPEGAGQNSLNWRRSAPIPEPTSGYGAGVIQGELVIAGGTYWEGTTHHWTKKIFSATSYAFDPQAERWQKLPNEPVPLGYAASAVIDDTLFVMGGYNGRQVNREIFTLTKGQAHYAWKKFGALPVDRVFAQAVAVGKNIYLLGGSKQFEPMDTIGTCCTTKTSTNTLMVLDTTHAAGGWRELAPYPGPTRWNFTAAAGRDSLWMFGGQYRGDVKGPVQDFTEVLRYNFKSNKWTLAGHLPQDLSADPFVSPVQVDGKVILISGVKKVWELNLETLKYRELTPLPAAAYVDKFLWLGNRLIGSGGENADSEGPRRRSDSTYIGRFIAE